MARPRGSAILSALRSCMHVDRSWALRVYAPVGALVGGFAAVLVILAFPTWVAEVEGSSATLLLGPGLLVLGGLGVVGGTVAPVLLAASRLPEPGRHGRHERIYATLGFGFVGAVYIGFVISAPPAYRSEPSGPIAPAIEWLYGLDPLLGLVPPVATLAVLAAYDRWATP